MAEEPITASIACRITNSEQQITPQGYFRSKLFISSSTSNILVAAANPILSLLDRVNISPSLPLIDVMHDNIEHELHAFRCKLTNENYDNEHTLIANYLLCATIDELLGKNYIRLYGQPAEFTAFTPSSAQDPQTHFFTIVQYLKEQTNHYLDLIELAYYCLLIGFEGEFHLAIDGRQKLESWIDELHHLIQSNRVHKPYRLFTEPEVHIPVKKHNTKIIIAMLCTIGVLITLYCISHLMLEHKAKTIIEKNNTLLETMENEWTTR